MQSRIKEARRSLGMTQTEFGARIGVKGNTVTGYETGLRSPSDAIITSMCREFHLSEEWLRFGRGEMFVTLTEDEELGGFLGRIALEDGDSFKKRFLRALSRLDEDQWAALERITRELSR